MPNRIDPKLEDSLALALKILEPFQDSSLYADYQKEDGWTDDEFDTMIVTIRTAVGR